MQNSETIMDYSHGAALSKMGIFSGDPLARLTKYYLENK